jgi:hypothetical protein
VGITQAWLETHVAKAGAELRHTFGGPEFGAAGLKLFESTFTRRSSVAAVLPSLFDCNQTDDYPSIDVRVSFADGSTTSAASDSQCPMMLPWQVKGQQRPTFNAHIARVVVAMMPETATNYGRFSDDVLRSELADLVQRSIEDDLAMLDVETRAPGVVERLRGATACDWKRCAVLASAHDAVLGRVCPPRVLPRARLTEAFGGAMIGAVREGNPRGAGWSAGPHKGHSVNQARKNAVNRSIVTGCSRLRLVAAMSEG